MVNKTIYFLKSKFKSNHTKGYTFSFISSILEAFPSVFPILIYAYARSQNVYSDDFPVSYVLGQYTLELIIVGCVVLIRFRTWNMRIFLSKEFKINIVAGVIVGLGYSFYYFGLNKTGPILNSVIILLFPVFTSISSQLLLKNKVTIRQYILLSLFFIALATMYVLKGLNKGDNDKFIGSLLILVAVVFWTMQAIFLQLSLRGGKMPSYIAVLARKIGSIPSHLFLFMLPYSWIYGKSFGGLVEDAGTIFTDGVLFGLVFAFALLRFLNVLFYYAAYKYIDADINVIIINTSFIYIPFWTWIFLGNLDGMDMYYGIFGPLAFVLVILYLIEGHRNKKQIQLGGTKSE